MTKEFLENLISEDQLVEVLAQKVFEKILEKKRHALVIFTGATTGCPEALESLVALKEQGYKFWVLLSKAAYGNLDVSAIKDKLNPEQFWVDIDPIEAHGLSAKFDTIIVPTTTINTAAQVATCVTRTPAASIIFDSLMRGKDVYVAVDGCCPDNESRAAKGFRINDSLKQTLRHNLELIQSFGATMTTAGKLAKVVSGGTVSSASSKEAAPVQKSAAATKEAMVDSRLISANHVRNLAPGSVLVVPANAMITQMAEDEARIRQVSIRRQM